MDSAPDLKKVGIRALETTLSLAIVVLVGAYIWRRRDQFTALLDLSALDVIVLGLGVLGAWLCNAGQSFLMYRAEGKQVGFWENLMLAGATNFGNYLPLRAGTLVRARYMKKVHGLSYSRTGSIFGIRIVLMVLSTGLLGLLGSLGLWFFDGIFAWQLLVAFLGLASAAVIVTAMPLPRFASRSGKLQRAWADFRAGFLTIRTRPHVSARVLLLMLLQYLTVAVRLHVALAAVGVHPTPFTLMVLAPGLGLSSFVAIVPGALGIREALMGYVSLVTGTQFSVGLFAATIDRGVMLAVTATLGFAGFLYVWHRSRRAE